MRISFFGIGVCALHGLTSWLVGYVPAPMELLYPIVVINYYTLSMSEKANKCPLIVAIKDITYYHLPNLLTY